MQNISTCVKRQFGSASAPTMLQQRLPSQSQRPGASGRGVRSQQRSHPCRPQLQRPVVATRAIELDFSDPDTQLSVAGVVLGLVAGLGAPLWYINRTERDEERLEELRAMNRATFEQTGEYMSDVSPAHSEESLLRVMSAID